MRIKGTLPKGDNDGISALEAQLNKDPDAHIAALVIFDVSRQEIDNDTKEVTVTLRFRRIEPILKEDKPTASQLIARAYEARTGAATLPIDLENEIRDALSGPDIYQPEKAAPKVDKGSPYGVMAATELRDELRRRGLDGEGKKVELIDRLISDDAMLSPEFPDEPPLSSEPAEAALPPLTEIATEPGVAFSDGGQNWNPEPEGETPWGSEYPEGH